MKTDRICTRSLAIMLLFLLGVSCISTACEISGYRYEYMVPVETGDGWQTASLSEKGLDTGPIVSLMNMLHKRDKHLIHSLLLVRDGSVVFEEYFEGKDLDLFGEDLLRDGTLSLVEKRFTRDDLHYCASVTKSVTSLLFGIAVDRGQVPGVEGRMFSFFPEYAKFSTIEKDRISVHHLLAMTSGLPFDEQTYPISDPRNDAFQLFFSEDPVAFMLGREVSQSPGTAYRYNSGTTVLLGEIIRRAVGQSVSSFAGEHLFEPLQISSYTWAEMPKAQGVSYTSGGLYLRPRDMAKIGQLMLQEGVWNGRRILSPDWVRRSVTQAIPLTNAGNAHGYGYQWKLGSFGGVEAYWAAGWGGQYIVVLPERNVVFVQTAGRYGGQKVPVSYDQIIENHILPAIKEDQSQSVSVDLTGEWTGYVILGNGSKADIRMNLVKREEDYSGIISGQSNTIPEMQLRNIILEGNRLTFELDFPNGQKIELIRFKLRYRDDILEGSYTDPTGDSDKVHLQRKQ